MAEVPRCDWSRRSRGKRDGQEAGGWRLLDKRTGAAAEGRPTAPHTEKVTVDELLRDLEHEYQANARGVAGLRFSLAHLRPVFGTRRAGQVTTADVNAYIVARQQTQAANATINRELAALKRAYVLATQATPPKLYLRPHIPMLTEDNVRSGFFERAQLDAVVRICRRPCARSWSWPT